MMVKLVSVKTGKESIIRPVERGDKKISAKEEAQRISKQYPGTFRIEEAAEVKSKKAKKILEEATDSKESQ